MAAQLEAERKEYETQVCLPFSLPEVVAVLTNPFQLELVDTSLQDDPENEELLALRNELVNCIQLLNDSLAELKGASSAQAQAQKQEPLAIGIGHSSSTSQKPSHGQDAPPAQAEEQPPKWSRENHPAFKKQSSTAPQQDTAKEDAPAPPVQQVNFQVNDTVMARWLSGDKGFYPAKIVSVTGSSSAPIYTVKFKSYDTVETLRAKDVKPFTATTTPAAAAATAPASSSSTSTGGVGAGFKRKADFDHPYSHSVGPIPSSIPASSAAGAAAITRNSDGITLSAGPELYPGAKAAAAAAAAAAEEAGKKGGNSKFDKDGKPKFKKIKANKELEKGKNKWQEFTQSGKFGKKGSSGGGGGGVIPGAKKESMFRTPEGIHGRGELLSFFVRFSWKLVGVLMGLVGCGTNGRVSALLSLPPTHMLT